MSPRVFVPRAPQLRIMEHQIATPRCASWAGMGMGKTTSTLTTVAARQLAGTCGKALVLAPKRVAVSTWPSEARKWAHLSGVEVRAAVGSVQERRAAIRDPNAAVITINYENIPWLVDEFKGTWPFDTIVADESTRLKSFRLRQGGQRARALATVAKHTRTWINLTGTPAPNGLIDLWGQQWFLDAGQRLGRSFSAFTSRWFMPDNIYSDYPKLIPQPFAEKQIHAALSDVCLSIRAEDYFDLKKPVVVELELDMPSAARQQYDRLERELYAEIDGHPIEAMTAAALSNKCGQVANGAAYTGEDGQWVEVHDVKLQALESIVEEAAGAPILVAYHFKSDLARLQRAFPQGRTLDDSPKTIDDWNAGKIPVLFAHPQSAGHGLNLQDGGNTLVFFGMGWSLEDHEQIIERIGPMRQMQAGHDRNVFIYYLLVRDTVDQAKLERMRSKRGVQEVLLEAMVKRH